MVYRHKLDEVLAIADRVTVLRRGRVTASGMDARIATRPELARLMVGREVLFHLEKAPARPGEVILATENLCAESDRGLPALRNVSISVRAGEILGIAGVAGNGQRELAQVITGLRPATTGRLLIHGADMINRSAREVISQGTAHIPEDRGGMGTVPNLSVAENLILKSYREAPIATGWFINTLEVHRQARELVDAFHIVTPSVQAPVRLLSGGNLQRVILAREITSRPQLMVAVHPTRGLDVGATEGIHRLLLEQRDAGAAILLISEDLDELLSLSDRIAVIFEGQIVGEVATAAADVNELGLMMAGTARQQ